ncbi:DUF402 domain-containing protein [Exiguobacterium sp. ERU656]|uniref:DUF402 domain-containing protein n=1 Tax=Exiguobacterium sp. ERU656 TaxID=2751217 RepID=UPI001BE70A05|nr:DUF402 domain-containing protein [Exiguobacterium sp. ERU656]
MPPITATSSCPHGSTGIPFPFDLDLDYVRNQAGTWQVVDRDEFLVNQRTFAYPARLIEQAEAALTDLIKNVTEGRFPFDGFLQQHLFRLAHRVN